jgi:hypothetical protein
MDFGEVLGSGWKIVWKHRILWIFGIFAGCARGGGGGGGGSGRRVTAPGNLPSGQNPFPRFEQFSTNLNEWIGNHAWVVVLFIVVVLLLVLLALWLGTMGRIGLIRGTVKADGGAERLGFGELWAEGQPFFWRILGLSLLLGLAFIILIIPLAAVGTVFGILTAGVGLLCLIPLFCILIPVIWIATLVIQQAESAIVIENLGITDGVRRGWSVFKQNAGPMLLIWLILLIVSVVAGIVIAIPVLVVVLPAAIVFVGTAARSGANPNLSYTPLIIAGLCLVAYFPFLLVLNGILTAYIQSVWTLTYLRLTRSKEIVHNTPILAPNA